MPKLFDRVKVNIVTTGTGTVTFGSASSNAFLTPSEAGAADGDTVRYVIVDGTDYEEGIGTIGDTVSTMARTTVTKSKIGGVAGTTKLNLSGAAVLALVSSGADIVNPTNNLSDLDDAAAARTNLGGTSVGQTVFTAADAAAVQTAAGGTSIGKEIFTAANAAAALTALGLAAGTAQRFTTPGAGTYTPSSAAVRWIRVRLVGGGGGGGGSNASSGQSDVGSGGGGGGYVENLMGAGTYNFVVGGGGSAQSNGGDTTFNSGSLNAGGGTGAPYNAGSSTSLGRATAAGNEVRRPEAISPIFQVKRAISRFDIAGRKRFRRRAVIVTWALEADRRQTRMVM